jgi:hypothetical protein
MRYKINFAYIDNDGELETDDCYAYADSKKEALRITKERYEDDFPGALYGYPCEDPEEQSQYVGFESTIVVSIENAAECKIGDPVYYSKSSNKLFVRQEDNPEMVLIADGGETFRVVDNYVDGLFLVKASLDSYLKNTAS